MCTSVILFVCLCVCLCVCLFSKGSGASLHVYECEHAFAARSL